MWETIVNRVRRKGRGEDFPFSSGEAAHRRLCACLELNIERYILFRLKKGLQKEQYVGMKLMTRGNRER
jgi:hypothetical protein